VACRSTGDEALTGAIALVADVIADMSGNGEDVVDVGDLDTTIFTAWDRECRKRSIANQAVDELAGVSEQLGGYGRGDLVVVRGTGQQKRFGGHAHRLQDCT